MFSDSVVEHGNALGMFSHNLVGLVHRNFKQSFEELKFTKWNLNPQYGLVVERTNHWALPT